MSLHQKNTIFLLKIIAGNNGSLRLTNKGNLPVKAIREYAEYRYKTIPAYFRINSEEDLRELMIIKILLIEAGYLGALKTKIFITEKGYAALKLHLYAPLYMDLFEYFVDDFDWLYHTRYPDECRFIQGSALFSLYILKQKASKYMSADVLYGFFETAFPMYRKPGKYADRFDFIEDAFGSLFLNDFCLLFGLTDSDIDDSEFFNFGHNWQYKTSSLFHSLLNWKI